MVGTLSYGLSLRDTSLVIIFFTLLCTIPPAFMGTLGPKTGMRQMIQARYAFGYNPQFPSPKQRTLLSHKTKQSLRRNNSAPTERSYSHRFLCNSSHCWWAVSLSSQRRQSFLERRNRHHLHLCSRVIILRVQDPASL
jgi:hypothetical protein